MGVDQVSDHVHGRLTEEDPAMASSLLSLMRDPELHITQVREVCEVKGRLRTRSISVEVKTPNVATHETKSEDVERGVSAARPLVVDLMDPRKGSLVDIELDDPNGKIKRASHSDHIWLAQYLIYYRWMSIVRSAEDMGPEQDEDFTDRTTDALAKLLRIPVEDDADEIDKILQELFTTTSLAEVKFLPAGDIDVSYRRVVGLLRLCEMLKSRYLKVVTVNSEPGERYSFSYRHQFAAEDTPDYDLHTPPTRRSLLFNQTAYRMRTAFGTSATSVRIHAPWAKRTSHYSLKVAPPRTHYATDLEVVAVERLTADRYKETSLDQGVLWSYDSNLGSRAHAFIGNGYKESAQRQLQFRLRFDELPGNSTFRLLLASTFLTFIMASLWIFSVVADRQILEPAVLVVVVTFVLTTWDTVAAKDSFYGTPVMIRGLGLSLAGLALLFTISTAASSALERDHENIALGADILAALWIVLTIFITRYAWVRYKRIIDNYKLESEGVTSSDHNMP